MHHWHSERKHNPSRFIRGVLAATLSVLATTGAIRADNTPPDFYLDVEHRINQGTFADWRMAAAGISIAHKNDERGFNWASYISLIGGPDIFVRTLFPLESLADLESRSQSRQIVLDHSGDSGLSWLQAMETLSESQDELISYVPELSNPSATQELPRYLWITRYHVAPGRDRQYFALMRQVRDAHLEANPDAHWVTYANAIGGGGRTVDVMIGFERFAELDQWRGDHEILKQALGTEEASRLLSRLASSADSETSLWRLDRGISQLD